MHYHSFAANSIEHLCNFHMALSSSGDTARSSLAAAIQFHRIRNCFPVGAHRTAVLEHHRPMQVVDVLGRESSGWHEGVLFWADAHAAMLERIAGFPASGKITMREDYPAAWDSADLRTIWQELAGDELRPFTDAIHRSNAKQPKPDTESDARHSIDFASVNWYGTPYTFTTNQALCVKVLWEAWENKTPALSGPEIIDQANISQERLDKVFRDKQPDGTTQPHPALKTMIGSPRKGRWCLLPPSVKSPT